jgi:Ca2+-binding RTX toxin-like protein
VQTTSVVSSLRRPVGMVERHDLSATGEQPYFVSRLAMLQPSRLSSIELPPGEPMPSAKQLLEMLSHLSKLNQPWSPPPGSTITEVIGKDGALAGVWVYPASTPDTGAFAETTTTTRITESGTRTIRIPELTLGTGNDSVTLYYHGMVDGGDGDDRLGAQFRIDASGYDSWSMPGGALLYGNDGNDYLSTSNQLANEDGDNILIGGRGRDMLIGGAGADTFMLLQEDSVDYITDLGSVGYRRSEWKIGVNHSNNPAIGGIAGNDHAALEPFYGSDILPDTLVFGAGVTAASLSVFMSAFPEEDQAPWLDQVLELLASDGTGAQIVLARADDTAGTGIEYVAFADGTRLTIGQVLARLDLDQDVHGSDLSDVIRTGAGNDRLDGGAGFNGAGYDYLAGGAGNDVYVIGRYSDIDRIDQSTAGALDIDAIEFAADITADDVALSLEASGQIVFRIEGADGGAEVVGWSVDSSKLVVRFADGTEWDAATIRNILKTIEGTSGADSLMGTDGSDIVLGYGGSDYLNAGAGDDTLSGGAGDDILLGGGGNDAYVFNRGDGADRIYQNDAAQGDHDTIRFGAGIVPAEVTVGRNGSDLVLSLSGTDGSVTVAGWFYPGASQARLAGVEFADGTVWDEAALAAAAVMRGTEGDDSLAGTNDGDILHGLAGDDVIDAGDGDDTLIGGASDDILSGGSGNDSYVFNRGDGADRIYQYDATEGDLDTIRFGADIAPAEVTVGRNGSDLTLSLPDADGSITVAGWFEPGASQARLAAVEFADGTVWDAAALAAAAVMRGTEGNDSLAGTNDGDTLHGLAGDDVIDTGAGDDTLIGGAGDDNLWGGAGNDVYVFNRGDGADRIDQGNATEGDLDVVRFGDGIAEAEVTVVRSGADLLLLVGDSGDSLRLTDWLNMEGASVRVARVEFAPSAGSGQGGTAWTAEDLAQKVAGTAPVVLAAVASQAGTEGREFRFTVPDTVFFDADPGDSLVLSATAADGGALPGWLSFDALSGEFSGTPGATDTGQIELRIVATDSSGLSASTTFDLAIGKRFAGTSGSDTLNYSAASFVGVALIDGGLGNDAITGSAGSDIIVGGAGTDNLKGEAGDDVFLVTGTDSGHDRFEGGDGYDVIQGSADDDTIRMYQFTGTATVEHIDGNGGFDIVAGTTSSDTLDFSGTELVGIALIDGGLGNDAVTGSAGNDVIVGGAGTDNLKGDAGDDVFLVTGTDAGHDRFEGGAGFDIVQGSAGNDTIRMYQFTGTTTVEHIDGNGGYDIVAGTSSSDTLDFSATELVGIARIDGGLGNDAITGSAGNDVIVGGIGTDNLKGEAGDDIFLVSGTDAGHDRFEGGDGYDVIQGSAGDDTIRMYQFTGAATVERIDGNGGYDIVAGTSSSDTLDFSATELVGIALIDGGLGNDAITGSAGSDIIGGGAGTDNLKGEAGDDVFLVIGTDVGHDRFEGGDGYDIVQGSSGDDTFRMYQFTGAATVERIEGNGGYDIVAGTTSSDTLDFSATELVGIVLIDGGLGNDAITGSAGNDVIAGAAGTDRLTGGQGSDTYRLGRGDGADTIVENDATSGATDAAEFLAGIGREQIWLRHVGNNLEAGVIGTSDKLIVQNWYLGEQYRVEEFRSADGGLLLDAQVENLVQAMAAFAPPSAGQTTLPPAYQEALAPVIAANWQ